MFLVPIFFGGGSREILDQCYEIRPTSDHCAKFHADQLTELGNLTLK